MKLFLVLMVFCSGAMAKNRVEVAVAASYVNDKSRDRKFLRFEGGETKTLQTGWKEISCKLTADKYQSGNSIKNLTLICVDNESGAEYAVMADCDTGTDTALMIRTKPKKQETPVIIINANCKTIEEKI